MGAPPGRKGGGPITFTHPKFLDPKAFGQSDLEDLQAANVSCQPGQALLATATHPDQEGITLGGPEDSADATPEERKTEVRNLGLWLFYFLDKYI